MTSGDLASDRVAIVLPDLRGGGAERVRLLLAGEFVERGLSVDLVMGRAAGVLLGEVPARCRVVDLAAPRLRSIWPALHGYLRRERPRAMLAAMWPLTGLACMATRTARVPLRLVVSEHNDFRMMPSITRAERHLLARLGRWVYAPASTVVAVSRGVEQSLQACAGLDPAKTRVIHNPVRRPGGSDFLAEDAALLAWWNGGGPRLLSVGTLKVQKAHDVLLRALARLNAHPDARLVILGEGPLRRETEALVASLGLAGRVRLPGFRHDPFPFLGHADLFVLASRWEGLGNVLIEALACGTPVVSTDCPSGPREILADGLYGTLVPPNHPAALARAIDAALSEPVDAGRLKHRAQHFSLAAAAEAYLEALLGPTDSH